MKTDVQKSPADFIEPLVINGLYGRVMHLPAANKNRKREILLIYGHHSALERMFGIAQNLAQYGSVTLPDLPGFGGMDSFYVIGQKPTLDSMADYLATFIKLRYKKRPITIGGMSYGFNVVARMLQRYPELANQVDLLISMVGFMHHEDFKLSPRVQFAARNSARLFTGAISAGFVRHIALRPIFIKSMYRLQANTHPKMKGASKNELKKRLDFEVFLWHANDVRTYMFTTVTMFTINITNTRVNLPVVHIAVDADQYFDNRHVKKHLGQVFSGVIMYKAHLANHAPTVISSAKEAEGFFPKELRKLLSKPPGSKITEDSDSTTRKRGKHKVKKRKSHS